MVSEYQRYQIKNGIADWKNRREEANGGMYHGNTFAQIRNVWNGGIQDFSEW